MNIKDAILTELSKKAQRGVSIEKLARILGIAKGEIKYFYSLILEMEKDGDVIVSDNGRLFLISDSNFIKGKIDGNPNGFGFLIPEDKNIDDVFIPVSAMNFAMHGDEVIIEITHPSQLSRKVQGRVIKILSRANHQIIGKIQMHRNFGVLVPLNPKLSCDIYISKADLPKIKDGQIAVAKILSWKTKDKNAIGKIVKIVDNVDDVNLEIERIIVEHRLQSVFPEDVIEEAKKLPQEVSEEDIKGRLDLRDKVIFTIDGSDTKDIDDAISIDKDEDSNFVLGVHIADVSHYVKWGMKLDKNALLRGNSTYMVDTVLPMLPIELSNGICSLFPNVDRLCLSVFMTYDKVGRLIDSKIKETIISSKRKLTYEKVSDYIEFGIVDDSIIGIENGLSLMNELRLLLANRRNQKGSIDFNFAETKIIQDESGKPVYIGQYERRSANQLIEEFMIAANTTIAEYFFHLQIPFLFRIHEIPDDEKVNVFVKMLRALGYTWIEHEELRPSQFQAALNSIKGKPEEAVVSKLMLRSLRKARYSPDSDLHFGLAETYYTHFTSPIRRYNDLFIHRIIKKVISGYYDDKFENRLNGVINEIAEHISETERNSELAERDYYDLKKAEFMLDKIGEEYFGVISSITSFGIFVQLENTVEGLIAFKRYPNKIFEYNESDITVTDIKTGNIYKLGQKIEVKLVSVSIPMKAIDFDFVSR